MRVRVALVVAVLGLVLVALLIEFKRVLQRPRRGPESPPLAESDDPAAPEPAAPRLASSASSLEFRSMGPVARRPLRVGLAHLRGRALSPGGRDDEGDPVEHLTVVADDGRRTFEAHVGPDNDRFELHLPPGRYTLTAHADALIGVLPGLFLVEGVEREVTVALEPAVSVTGRIHGAPADGSAFLLAFGAGTKINQGDGEIDGDVFSFTGLGAGHGYDLVFGGTGMRTMTIRGIPAPTQGLDVTLSPLPILRGALGFARGAVCPFTKVSLAAGGDETGGQETAERDLASIQANLAARIASSASDEGVASDDDESSVELAADCRFELTLPADRPEVTVVATGPGWHLEERVMVPSEGDPDPVCFNPPCRVDPLEGLANLVVRLEIQGDPSSDGESLRDQRVRARAGREACTGNDLTCRLQGLPVGKAIPIEARRGNCTAPAQTVVLGPGENFVSLSCLVEPSQSPTRQVQGIVRTATGSVPEHLAVRCAGFGPQRDLRGTLVFSLSCPWDASILEYQVQREGPWIGVMIPAALDPALVEIGVGPL